jgi:hypothetical protein
LANGGTFAGQATYGLFTSLAAGIAIPTVTIAEPRFTLLRNRFLWRCDRFCSLLSRRFRRRFDPQRADQCIPG